VRTIRGSQELFLAQLRAAASVFCTSGAVFNLAAGYVASHSRITGILGIYAKNEKFVKAARQVLASFLRGPRPREFFDYARPEVAVLCALPS
jgi:hypothetical protein